MAHGYRTLQHWDHWLAQQFLGQELLAIETQVLPGLISGHFAKQALLVGVPHQQPLLQTTVFPCQALVTPLMGHESSHDEAIHLIEGDLHELPLLTGSIDLAILPHTLEFIDNPRQLLAEACRVIKPEGLIVICGFNPHSTWGLKKMWSKATATQRTTPWNVNFIRANMIKRWLQLADFQLEQHTSALYRPPINHPAVYQQLHFLERVGKICFPAWGGIYFLVARAKVTPLTPIKLKWKQQLSRIGISTTIPGNIAR